MGEKVTTILALSDTHLNDGNLPPKIVELAKTADLVLHAGNFTSQAAYNALKNACKGELWAVYGDLDPKNPDGSSILKDSSGKPLGKEVFKKWNNVISIYLANDPCKSEVFSESELMEKAEEKGADLLVFGHINQPIIVWGKKGVYSSYPQVLDEAKLAKMTSRLLVCPGSSSVTSIHNSSFPSVALLELGNIFSMDSGKVFRIKLVRVINFQDKWRCCGKCRGLFFGPNAEESKCPAGGKHDSMNLPRANYLLANGVPKNAPGEANWGRCSKCQVLFFTTNTEKSKCPAGGTHDSNGSVNYTLIHSHLNGPQQVNWRRCEKCQGLFDASGGKGVCPDGGTKKEPHITTGSGNYEVEWG